MIHGVFCKYYNFSSILISTTSGGKIVIDKSVLIAIVNFRTGTNVASLAQCAIVIWIRPQLMMALMVTFIAELAMPANSALKATDLVRVQEH